MIPALDPIARLLNLKDLGEQMRYYNSLPKEELLGMLDDFRRSRMRGYSLITDDRRLNDDVAAVEKAIYDTNSTIHEYEKQLDSGEKLTDQAKHDYQTALIEYERLQTIRGLLPRINSAFYSALIHDPLVLKKFSIIDKNGIDGKEVKQPVDPVAVLSLDIRNSTTLMLNARTPQAFADFLTDLSAEFVDMVKANYGVYEKFTGDGMLCFFPEFLSGKDYLYYAIKTAQEAQAVYAKVRDRHSDAFTLIMLENENGAESGVGAGIDVGSVSIAVINSELSIIGQPVVYACRLCGGKAGQILLNQSARTALGDSYGSVLSIESTTFSFKNQGTMRVYNTHITDDTFAPARPPMAK